MHQVFRRRTSAGPAPGCQWHSANDVLSCHTDSTTILFALETGRYYTLNGTGAQVWRLLSVPRDLGDIIESIQVASGSVNRVRDDVVALMTSLAAAGLIQSSARASTCVTKRPGPTVARVRSACELWRAGFRARQHTRGHINSPMVRGTSVPSRTMCFVALAMCHILLKLLSLKTVIAAAYVAVPGEGPQADDAWSHELTRRIESAATVYPFHAECLERSLTFLWLTRRAGMKADLRFGVDPFPFEAHAWVESGGRPLNELDEAVVRFTTFPPLSADWLAGVI